MIPTLKEMNHFALTIHNVGAGDAIGTGRNIGDSDLALQAVAFLVLARMRYASRFRFVCGDDHPEFGGGALSEACYSLRFRPHKSDNIDDWDEGCFHDPVFCRAFSTACLVLHGDIADPTNGATHFHHHLDNPPWSVGHQPSALIGAHFFYNSIAQMIPIPQASTG